MLERLFLKLRTLDGDSRSSALQAASFAESNNKLTAGEISAFANFKLPLLSGKVEELRLLMGTPPPNVQVTFPGIVTGVPQIDSFLAGSKMEYTLSRTFTGVPHARKVLLSFHRLLPSGVVATAGGHGRRAFIQLTKPHQAERKAHLDHRAKKVELSKFEKELGKLKSLQKPKSFIPLATSTDVEPPKKRQKTTESGAGVVLGNGEPPSVGLSVSGAVQVSSAIDEEVICID